MLICDGQIVGYNKYQKDGKTFFYAQVVFNTNMSSYTGKRVASCKVENEPKVGDKVRVTDDFRYPQILEN